MCYYSPTNKHTHTHTHTHIHTHTHTHTRTHARTRTCNAVERFVGFRALSSRFENWLSLDDRPLTRTVLLAPVFMPASKNDDTDAGDDADDVDDADADAAAAAKATVDDAAFNADDDELGVSGGVVGASDIVEPATLVGGASSRAAARTSASRCSRLAAALADSATP